MTNPQTNTLTDNTCHYKACESAVFIAT